MPDLRTNEFMVVEGQGAADVTGSVSVNPGFLGVLVFININTITGSSGTAESVTVTIEGLSPVGTDEFYTILASSALTATGLTVLRVYPGLVAAANLTVNDVLPASWRVSSDVTTDGDQAYDVDIGFVYIP